MHVYYYDTGRVVSRELIVIKIGLSSPEHQKSSINPARGVVQ